MKLFAPSLQEDLEFPAADETEKGRILFLNKRVWIAAEVVSGVVSWIPLTNEIDGYVHIQESDSATWTITHNLNTGVPIVQVYDETHTMVIPDSVDPQDNNVVEISFGAAMSGSAVILAGNAGSGTARGGSEGLQYAYEQEFTGATSVTLNHALGYNPIVRVFVGNQEIQPQSVIHDSILQTTITFSSAQTGIARLI